MIRRVSKTWRLLDLEFADAYMNIAVEEAILIAVDWKKAPNTIRFWRNLNSVVIGRNQDVREVVDFEACKRLNVMVIRRFTGGGAVFNDEGNLNWSIFIRKEDLLNPSNILGTFEIFGKGVAEGLQLLGINARFQQPNMIQLNNKKISGLSIYVKPNAILCHGTMLINTNLHILSEVLPLHRKSAVEVTCIEKELNERIPLSLIKAAILRGLNKSWGIKAEPGTLSEMENEIAKKLYANKYSRDEWNLHIKDTYIPASIHNGRECPSAVLNSGNFNKSDR